MAFIVQIPDVQDFQETDSVGSLGLFAVSAAEETDAAAAMIFGPSSVLIQVKRGLDASLPASFAMGEPAFTTDTFRFFLGTGSGLREVQVLSVNGYLIIKKTSAPADAELANSQCAFWWDPTPGSAAFKIKGKNSSGTVVTASFSAA